MMINKWHTVRKERSSSIIRLQKIIAMLLCFCLSAALTPYAKCGSQLKGSQHSTSSKLEKDSYNKEEKALTVEDYYDHNQCLSQGKCLLKKIEEGDKNAIKTLFKGIPIKSTYKPPFISFSIIRNIHNEKIMSLMLEHINKKNLMKNNTKLADFRYKNRIELISSYQEANGLPSYEEATGLPSYEEATKSSFFQERSKSNPYITLTKRLIVHKVDLNSWNRSGETVVTAIILMIATIENGPSQNLITLLELLLQAGANVKCLNDKGQAPLDIVHKIPNKQNRQKIVDLLIKYGANPLCASTNKVTEEYILKSTIDQVKKVDIYSISREELPNVDARLQAFFNDKYNTPHFFLLRLKSKTCIACYRQEKKSTTIKIPSCGHHIHGSCLVGSLINQAKGYITWNLLPSYNYKHFCPYCKGVISDAFVQDLSIFYNGVKFSRKGISLAMQALFITLHNVHYLPFLFL